MDIGLKLQRLRSAAGWSQRELARRAGVTFSTVSLVERNKVSPSVSSLEKILQPLELSLAGFFAADEVERRQVFFLASEMKNLGDSEIALKSIAVDRADRRMSLQYLTYQPSADTGKEMRQHDGEQAGVVVAGFIEITVEDQTQRLLVGDGFYFQGSSPHRFCNPGSEPCIIVSAHTPALSTVEGS